MKDIVNLVTVEQIKAYSDPYRLRILTFLRNRREASTVKEIADYLGEVPAKVHYHIKKLEKVGIVEIVRTKEVKEIVAKYYYLTAENFQIEGEDIKNQTRKIYKSQILNIVNEYYDKSKEKSIDTLMKKVNLNSKNNAISIISRDMNIDEDLFKQFDIELRELVKKYESIPKKNRGNNHCHIFSVCLNQGNDKETPIK